jgi:hypothetical protein
MSETFTLITPESSTKAGLSPSTDKSSTLTDANRNETTPISDSSEISDRKGTTKISNTQEKTLFFTKKLIFLPFLLLNQIQNNLAQVLSRSGRLLSPFFCIANVTNVTG